MPKILIIDDEADVRTLLRGLLEFNGYEVIEAPDGSSGIRMLEAALPDLIITDIVMPGQEGISTIREVRRKQPNARIIAISGGGSAGPGDYLQIAKKLGANLVFPKPVDFSSLLRAVRTLLS